MKSSRGSSKIPPRILGSIWLWWIMSVGLVVVPTADARIGEAAATAATTTASYGVPQISSQQQQQLVNNDNIEQSLNKLPTTSSLIKEEEQAEEEEQLATTIKKDKVPPSRPQRKEKKKKQQEEKSSSSSSSNTIIPQNDDNNDKSHPQQHQHQSPLRSSIPVASSAYTTVEHQQPDAQSTTSLSGGSVLGGTALHDAANRPPSRSIGNNDNERIRTKDLSSSNNKKEQEEEVISSSRRRRMKLTANSILTSSASGKPQSNVLITTSSKPIVTSIHHQGTRTSTTSDGGGSQFSPQGHDDSEEGGGYCGDGYQDLDTEECDFGNDNGYGYCTLDCKLLTNHIPICGNGIREGYEECDWGYYNGYSGKGGCTLDCMKCGHTFQADLSEYLKSFNILRPNSNNTPTSSGPQIASNIYTQAQRESDGSKRNLLLLSQQQQQQQQQERGLTDSSPTQSPTSGNVNGDVRFAPPGGWTGLNPTDAPEYPEEETPEPSETSSPIDTPTEGPTPGPGPGPTTPEPTNKPSKSPTPSPTLEPTPKPSPDPTPQPTKRPTQAPSQSPTPEPTLTPTQNPTISPTARPTNSPSPGPTQNPTPSPTPAPTPDEPDDTNDDKDESISGGGSGGSGGSTDGEYDGDGEDKYDDCIEAGDIEDFLNEVGDKEEIQSTKPASTCSYEIEVDGKTASDDDCFESQSSSGVSGSVSGSDASKVVVWDDDAPCDSGKTYIHFAGSGTFQDMTAGAGPTVHTYKAAVFSSGLPITEGSSGCTTFSPPSSTSCQISWEVARDGTSCPSRRLQIVQKSEEIDDKKNTVVIDGVEYRICKPGEEGTNGKDSGDDIGGGQGGFTEDKDKDKEGIDDREEDADGSDDDTNSGGNDKDPIGRGDDPCALGDPDYTQLSFTIDTDWYSPLENSVYLVNENELDDPVILAEPINSFRPEAVYEFSTCLPNDGCFEFYVFDSAMDGFQDGSGFELDLDGKTLLDNLGSNQNGTYENYESFWSVKFGGACKIKEGEELAEGVIPFVSELIKSVRDWFGEGSPPPIVEGEGDGNSS